MLEKASAALRTALRDPLIAGRLLVDLLPVYAVFALGWGAAPLVVLYWLENAVIGLITLLRMLIGGFMMGPLMLFGALFLCTFFTFHYGLFWFVHGVFVMDMVAGMGSAPEFGQPVALFQQGISFEAAMPVFIAMILAWELIVLVFAFLRGDLKDLNPQVEMFSPYFRVVALHIGIIFGGFLLISIGDPALGVLILILGHAAWNMVMGLRRRQRKRTKVDAASDSVSS